MTDGFHLLDGATAPRGWTLEMKTSMWGVWHLTTMAFASQEEAGGFADDATARWPDLVAEWKVVETNLAPTHSWSKTDGLTPLSRDEQC